MNTSGLSGATRRTQGFVIDSLSPTERSISTLDMNTAPVRLRRVISRMTFNDSDGDGKTLGNYFTAGDPGQWNQFGDADECATGHDVLLQSMWTNAPAGYSEIWNRVHRYCSNPLDSTSNDTDGDGISDWDEIHQERTARLRII